MAEDYKTRIYDRYVSHISEYDNISEKGLRRWAAYYRAHYMRFFPSGKNAAILDIGCGYGRLIHFLKEAGYQNICGIDVSRQLIDITRQMGLTCTQCADMFAFLDGKEDRYDVVTMMDVLEHLEKQQIFTILDNVFSSLRPGGRIILQLPNALTPMSVYRDLDFTHETAFTSTSIKDALTACGFANIRSYPIVPHIHGPVSLAMNLMWRVVWQNLIRLYMFSANGNLMGDIYTSNLITVAEKREG